MEVNQEGLVKSQNRHLLTTELQDDTTSPPSLSWLLGVSRARSSCGHCHITTGSLRYLRHRQSGHQRKDLPRIKNRYTEVKRRVLHWDDGGRAGGSGNRQVQYLTNNPAKFVTDNRFCNKATNPQRQCILLGNQGAVPGAEDNRKSWLL